MLTEGIAAEYADVLGRLTARKLTGQTAKQNTDLIMIHKVTVGLPQKIGQPNFGGIGASCHIEVHLDDEEASCPELITGRVKQAFAQCRTSIAQELEGHTEASPRESMA